MLDYCFCHHCRNICWSLTCWTVCSMSRSWDGPVRGGFAAEDLVAGLCCPLPVKLRTPPLQPYLQGCVRPLATAGARPDMHPKQKNWLKLHPAAWNSRCSPGHARQKKIRPGAAHAMARCPRSSSAVLLSALVTVREFCHQRGPLLCSRRL